MQNAKFERQQKDKLVAGYGELLSVIVSSFSTPRYPLFPGDPIRQADF
jgi:hypothetical protein